MMKTIDGSPFVTMEPRSIATKRYQMRQRSIGIVPHAKLTRPLTQAVLTSGRHFRGLHDAQFIQYLTKFCPALLRNRHQRQTEILLQ